MAGAGHVDSSSGALGSAVNRVLNRSNPMALIFLMVTFNNEKNREKQVFQ